MNKCKWVVLATALGMMAVTGDYLIKARQRMRLGEPGVKVGPGLLYNDSGQVVASNCVILPDVVMGIKGTNCTIGQAECSGLPADTTFGRKWYGDTNDPIQTSVVLMRADRTSIHDPHYCLTAADWKIQNTEQVFLPMDRPYPYQLEALKLTVSRTALVRERPVQYKGIYIYWFVSGDKVTSHQGARFWSLARTMVETGILERWAYISYFKICIPGQEEATFKELAQFIRASAPEFQTVAGPPASADLPVVSR